MVMAQERKKSCSWMDFQSYCINIRLYIWRGYSSGKETYIIFIYIQLFTRRVLIYIYIYIPIYTRVWTRDYVSALSFCTPRLKNKKKKMFFSPLNNVVYFRFNVRTTVSAKFTKYTDVRNKTNGHLILPIYQYGALQSH